jgi:hypothetical protein
MQFSVEQRRDVIVALRAISRLIDDTKEELDLLQQAADTLRELLAEAGPAEQ